MDNAFRVVAWNVHGAKADPDRGVWKYLLELDPDVAFLQEVGGIPQHVRARFVCHEQRAMTNSSPQRFSTALLVKGPMGQVVPLPAPADWVARELKHFAGNLVARELLPDNGPALKAVCVGSPAANLGLVECLRHKQGALTPTFRNTSNGGIVHQMDHLFVTEVLAQRLTACDTGSRDRVFGSHPRLSDHLPVVADFRPPAGTAV